MLLTAPCAKIFLIMSMNWFPEAPPGAAPGGLAAPVWGPVEVGGFCAGPAAGRGANMVAKGLAGRGPPAVEVVWVAAIGVAPRPAKQNLMSEEYSAFFSKYWPMTPQSSHMRGYFVGCCLMAPSNYLDYRWPTFKVMWHSSGGNFTGNNWDISYSIEIENNPL